MKITLKRTEEQVELVKAMASRNREVAYEAQMALAEFIGPVLAEVVNQAPTLSNLFTNFQFNDMDSPSIPLDLYYDVTAPDYVKVYSTSVPGGLPTNTVTPTVSEMKFTTYRLDSAVDFDKRYAAKSRLDVVGKSFTRIAQEILLRQESTSANLILGALAEATTNSKNHLISGGQTLILDDFNQLLTKAKRINTAWTGGTSEGRIKGVTDLIMSPEAVQGLREMAYNPVNTRGVAGGVPATGDQPIAATDEMRNAIYQNAGIPEFYGISIMEINELGKDQKFTKVWNGIKNPGGTADGDLVIGLDRSRESLFRAVALDSETGSEFTLLADDQYSVRQQKIGYFGSLEEGRMILDDRVLTGITLTAPSS
tara:strand:- start:6332 stop:7435 length:1104 start_codon:yes stop_codon:yes gene_type:complete